MKFSSLVKSIVTGLAVTMLCSPAFAADTIKLGVAGAHSGDLASYGLPTVNAAKVVVKKINDNGGINGKMVELLIQDDQCKAEQATNAATKLVSDGANIVLGHICSGATKAALPIYNENKVVTMSPSATSPGLTKSGDNPTFFRTIAPDDLQAEVAVDFAIGKLASKKIAIIHDKGDYGKGFAEFVRSALKANGGAEEVLFEGVTPGAPDYSAVVQKIRRSKADTVIYGGYHPEAAKLIAQMRKKRVKANFVGADGVKDATFIKVAGKNAEGVYASGPIDVANLPMNKQSIEEHVAMFGTKPGAFYDSAYAATVALLKAIERADSTDFASVTEKLHTEYVETPIGKIRFTKQGDAEGIGFSMYQVQKGKFTEVK